MENPDIPKLAEKCKTFNITIDNINLESGIMYNVLAYRIKELEHIIYPPAHSGIKLNKIIPTADTYFCTETNPEKIKVYKEREEKLKLIPTFPKGKLLQRERDNLCYLKDLEPPNEHKMITQNLYLFDVLDLEKFDFYIFCTKEGALRYATDIYQLSKNNKYAHNTENLKDCGIYPEHADAILYQFFGINTLT